MCKRYKFTLAFFLIFISNSIYGQKIPLRFEENLNLINVVFTLPEQYSLTPSESSFGEYACKEESCPLRKLKIVDAELIHSNGHCRVYIYVSGADRIRYGKLIQNNSKFFGLTDPANLSYNRIKSNFRYGRSLSAASEQDIEDLNMMLSYYPPDSAKAAFNADYMLCYPFNMEGKKCREEFTRTRVIVAGKNGFDIFLYFVLTDEGIKDFDKYLCDFKGVFWFKEE